MIKKAKILFLLFVIAQLFTIPERLHTNKGASKSIGKVGKGQLENAWLIPYSGENFKYFSFISYYFMKNGYLHSKVHDTLLDAYQICEKTCPETYFRLMECANKKGGKMAIHNTHQTGMSVDFMVPKIKNGKPSRWLDKIGLWSYLLEFTDDGKSKIDKEIEIDFEMMGKHILALDKAARKNGLRIKMVILKIELKDDFYKTKSGKKVKQKGIYFARHLKKWVNKVHDDHYHIDFAPL